jgi:hypothetical protein
MTFQKWTEALFVLVTLIFCLNVSEIRGQQQRGPSTAEERARAVQVAKSLRTAPLAENTTKDCEWLMLWQIEVPDISVKLCGGVLGDLGDTKKSQYPGALLATMMASEANYVIENPRRAKANSVMYFAGIESALDAYQAIRSTDSSYHAEQLDELNQKRMDGKLADAVRSVTKKCK